MAEPPSSSSSIQVTPTADDNEEVPARSSKRKRLSNTLRRLLSRMSTFIEGPQSIQVEIEGNPSNDDVELQPQEEGNGQATPPSNEILTNSRQSKAACNVDLSGSWKPIVTEEFKKEYDSYLVNCGEGWGFRKVVVNGIGYQKETIRQLNDGVDLEIVATNPAGNWNRTLVASEESTPLDVIITDPDGDRVRVEAWWEENGTRHKSLLRGKPRVEGGEFETVRYLESDDVLVCESSFNPAPSSSTKFKYGLVTWKFRRVQ